MNIFKINRSEIRNRLEPKFYSLKYLDNEKKIDKSPYSVRKLSEISIFISDGTHFTPKYQSFGKIFLSVKDVRASNIDYSNSMFISDEEFEILNRRCKPQKNDILLTKIGSIGFAAVVETNEDFQIFVSLALIRPKTWCVLPYYLEFILNSNLSYLQFDRCLKGAGVPDLHLEEIRNIKIPLPPLSVQQNIVDLYIDAQNKRKQELKESKKLLESVDDYLLSELEIELPKKDNSLKNRIFISHFHNVAGGRIDPLSNTIVLEKLRSNLNNSSFIYLKDVITETKLIETELSSNDTYIGLENIGSNNGNYIKTDEKETISSALRFEKGQILFPKLRPYLNKVYLAEFNGLCSTEFHVFNAKNIDVNFLYYCLLSRITLEQTSNLMTGNTLPRLQSSDIAHILIPNPPLEKQKKIVKHIQQIRNQAKQLKNEADMILQETKQKIEKMILGEEQ